VRENALQPRDEPRMLVTDDARRCYSLSLRERVRVRGNGSYTNHKS
jgi:hypothetical protein